MKRTPESAHGMNKANLIGLEITQKVKAQTIIIGREVSE